MDDQTRRLTSLLLFTTLGVGGFYVYSLVFPPEPADESGAEDTAQMRSERSGSGEASLRTCEEAADREHLATIETEDFRATISSFGGGIRSFELIQERYLLEEEETGTLVPNDMVTTDRCAYYAFGLSVPGLSVGPADHWDIEQTDPEKVTLRWSDGRFELTRTLEPGDGPYQLWSSLTIRNTTTAARTVRVVYDTSHYVTRDEESGGFFASRSPGISHGICYWGDDETTRLDREDGLPTAEYPRGHGFGPPVQFAGVESAFFANVMAAEDSAWRCRLRATDRGDASDPAGSLFEAALVYDRAEVPAHGELAYRTLAFLGPKDNDALTAAGHHLEQVVDLGWFAAVASWLVAFLRWIHGYVGNWGIAIIVMTVVIRVVFFPLTWKSFQSMAKMRVLKPEMDRINREFADDREKKGAAVMELYRKHKINPLGGCLPQLLQMPVWFAFYASLSTNVELYHADFALWWKDLSAPDPYFSLPLVLGGLMHFQQRITPTAMDPVQQKMMMYFMPLMITGFMLFLPAGLCLYMVTNSVLGIAQQQWIHRSLNQAEQANEVEGDDEPASTDVPGDPLVASGVSRDASSVVNRSRPKKKVSKRRTRRARS